MWCDVILTCLFRCFYKALVVATNFSSFLHFIQCQVTLCYIFPFWDQRKCNVQHHMTPDLISRNRITWHNMTSHCVTWHNTTITPQIVSFHFTSMQWKTIKCCALSRSTKLCTALHCTASHCTAHLIISIHHLQSSFLLITQPVLVRLRSHFLEKYLTVINSFPLFWRLILNFG